MLALSWNLLTYSGTKSVTPFCRTCPTSRNKSFPSSVERVCRPGYDYSSPDLATIAFSCAITSEIAYIAVHWCQRIADNDHWYMAVVRRFFLAEDDDIQKLRLSLHNIIDWGLSERLKSIKGELKVLDER